jgi:hypothetical protein
MTKRAVRTALVGAVCLAVGLVAGACTTPIPVGDWGTTRFAPGAFAFEYREGGELLDSGGGQVTYAINRYSAGGGQSNYGGSFTTGDDFEGPQGEYAYGIRAETSFCCGTYARTLVVTTPDGQLTIDTGDNAVEREYFYGDDSPCPGDGNGIYLSSKGPANGDPSTEVTIALLVCDRALATALSGI